MTDQKKTRVRSFPAATQALQSDEAEAAPTPTPDMHDGMVVPSFSAFRPEPGESFVYSGETKDFAVMDGGRRVFFKGVQLAYLSSERPGVSRWTDISIFLTNAHQFVVNKIGVSAVAHLVDCPTIANKTLPTPMAIHDTEIAIEDRDPCPTCNPNILFQLENDPASLRIERDRHWTGVSATAAALIDSMHVTRNGTRNLPSLAAGTLEMAAKYSEEIYDALMTTRVA